jgi:hydroxyethylthiazole kinase-like uncharacterized protein yjeF
MYHADALAISRGTSEAVLVERAGRAVAEEIVRRFGARRTVVLCGPGNNGNDGRVAARYLQQWGWTAVVGDDLTGAELIVDALYGAGLSRDFPAGLAARIAAAGVPVVAIDVPSGLDGATGAPRGSAVTADLTITFFRKKPGHVLLPGRGLCGEVVVADIGIPDDAVSALGIRCWENQPPRLKTPDVFAHKYQRGHAVVLSGSRFHTGAARLAATAALRSGAGLVTIAGAADALGVQAAHVTAIMLTEVATPADLATVLADRRKNALCIGPAAGVGPATLVQLDVALASGAATVIDADGLTSAAKNPQQLFDWISKSKDRDVVLTPHEGEFARLFGDGRIAQASKIERARQAARLSCATVLYKGPDTVIAHPDGRAVVNTNAPASLATAGSGDVLAGIITGLLAQGLPGFEAACAAAWLHGDAARRRGAAGLTAEGLLDVL